MTFLNPFLLFGIAGVAAPIIIHLMAAQRVKKVAWAAMRFVRESVQKNKRQLQIEDLILLALRCLLLALLAVALARPALTAAMGALGGLFGSAGPAVILLDNSYSMSQSNGVTSRFDLAQKAAEELVDSMPGGTSVAVYLASDVAVPLIPEPSYDLNLARKVIREAAVSDRGTSLGTAFQKAIEVLERKHGGRIYLFTDGQAAGWAPLEDVTSALEAAKPGISARVVIVGEPVTANLGVTALALASPLAPAGEPLRFEAEVTNAGTQPARGVQVRLSVDGGQAGDSAVIDELPPGEAKRVSLFAKFADAGFHTVSAEVPADRLPADDARVIAVRVLENVGVLIVDGDPGQEAREGESFFLRHALTPVPGEQLAGYFVKPKVVTVAEFESAKLSDYDVVVLANVAEFSPRTAEALEAYVRRGGGLVVFPGGKTNAGFYNSQLGFLPATLGEAKGDAERQTSFFTLQTGDYEHPIVKLWSDPGAGSLGTTHFYRGFELGIRSGGEEVSPQRVVLNYADGRPAVVEGEHGFGRVVLFSSTADTAWNDLPLRPAFVPLMQQTLGHLLDRGDERLNARVGQTLRYIAPADWVGRDVTIVRAGGDEASGVVRRVVLVEGAPLLEFDETDRAGAYRAVVAGEAMEDLEFAVQSDPAESRIEELSEARLEVLRGSAEVVRWGAGSSARELGEERGTGAEFWFPLALLALCCAVAETICAERFSRAK